MLGTQYHLTQHKIRDLLAQVLGVDFSVGAISQAHGLMAQALAAPVQQARQGLLDAAADAASVVGMDETRYPREGAANWVWAAVRPKLVVFNILPSRARYVAKEMIGEKPRALLVSDRYVVYNWLERSSARCAGPPAARLQALGRARRDSWAYWRQAAGRGVHAVPLARAGSSGCGVPAATAPSAPCAGTRSGADAMPAYPGHLRGTAQAGTGAVELPATHRGAAHEQRQ